MGWINSRDFDEISEKNNSIKIKDKAAKIVKKENEANGSLKNSYKKKRRFRLLSSVGKKYLNQQKSL